MSETLEQLSRRRSSAAQLSTVVRTMKALAASNITQYEKAVESLDNYYHTVSLSLFAILSQEADQLADISSESKPLTGSSSKTVILVFGSDQGLVGRFNDVLADFANVELTALMGEKEAWIVGEQMKLAWPAEQTPVETVFPVPTAVESITGLIDSILEKIEALNEKGLLHSFYIFYQAPQPVSGYKPDFFKLLPLDEEWKNYLSVSSWPGKQIPQLIGSARALLPLLTREYLFVSLFKAAAGSLASENASRLEAMQRAQKNIDDMQDELSQDYNRLRQSTIDSELFDLIAGFEAMTTGATARRV